MDTCLLDLHDLWLCMKILISLIRFFATKRAEWLWSVFKQELSQVDTLLDVGSGTGDFGEVLRSRGIQKVLEIDVANFSFTHYSPVLFDGQEIPFESNSFDVVTLIAVLQYNQLPNQLLAEAARVSRGTVLIMQTVSTGGLGSKLHWLEELIEGRMAWYIAKLIGCFKGNKCPLQPINYLMENGIKDLLQEIFSNWTIIRTSNSWVPSVRHLFIVAQK